MADHAQVIHSGSAHFVGIAHGFHAHFACELRELLAQIGQRLNELTHGFVGHFGLDELLNQFAEFFECGALVAQHFAAQQVERLDGVGAFVNHVDAGIAHILLHAPLLDVAVATKHLHAGRGGLPSVVGGEGFDNGREQGHDFGSLRTHGLVRVVELFVEQQRTVASQGAAAFGVGLGRHEHAAYIGVNDDRIGRFSGRFDAGERAHLHAVFGVGQCVLVSHFGQAQ